MSVADSNTKRNKGGCIWRDKDGYLIKDWVDKNGRHRKRLHRLVMEQVLGRELLSTEIVHHKDHNKENNMPENLEIIDGHRLHKLIYHPGAWNKGKIKWFPSKCKRCKAEFLGRFYTRKFCSRHCSALHNLEKINLRTGAFRNTL